VVSYASRELVLQSAQRKACAIILLKAFLQVPELSTVGSTQERAAFIAVRLEGRTVREAGQAVGVSKSQVTNLADLFQAKLTTRMMGLRRNRIAVSAEYRTL
jgi:DNA-directed RNA polymerase specialized sigma24 family protein